MKIACQRKELIVASKEKIRGSLVERYGTYYAVISLKDENGKRKQKWIPTGYKIKGNKKKATDFLNAKIREYEDMNLKFYSDITVAEYFTLWLSRIKNEVRANTYRTYHGNMTNHIIPYFQSKKIKLQELSKGDVTDYFSYISEHTDLSSTSLKHHKQNISKALADAVDKEYISFNVATGAKIPMQNKKVDFEVKFLNNSQLSDLRELFKNTTIALPVTLCSIYGMRRSEVLGLKWRNIDFESGKIYIKETLQQSTKEISGDSNFTAPTKTNSSERALPITEKARKLLIEQRKTQLENQELLCDHYFDDNYVCTFADGKVISPNYLSKNFHKILSKSDLPQIRLHDLRHSVASNLLGMGFSVVQVAEWLGHSDSRITLEYYAHADVTSKMAIGNALDRLV